MKQDRLNILSQPICSKGIRLFGMFLLVALLCQQGYAQKYAIKGKVNCDDEDVAGIAEVFLQNTPYKAYVNDQGNYSLQGIPPGEYTLVAYAIEHEAQGKTVQVNQDLEVDFHLHEFAAYLDDITVQAKKDNEFGITRLKSVDGMGIYEGKKTEVLVLEDIVANAATSNSRQVFSRVTGLNIWESDCAGIQLGVGGRGLSPNRSSNFNTRQNGVDMSADALGYPESYYAPPIQAVEQIEVVRGAASLQYGTQFGGLLNFDLKDAPEDRKLAVESSQTIGSYNYFNSFNSVGGTVDDFSYYGYYQYRTGDCWRCNSGFDAQTAYLNLGYDISDKLSVSAEMTHMTYLAQQPGGLTDEQFEENPRQSNRNRNWFRVKWNLPALHLNYRLSDKTKLNTRFFGLMAGREALGNLDRIDRPDNTEAPRTLIDGEFLNWGNETRLLHHYQFLDNPSSFLMGVRAYQGTSNQLQGAANNGPGADFNFLAEDSLAYAYKNEGRNLAVFAENIINLSPFLSITPGVRFEYIETASDGYYRKSVPTDLSGNPISPEGFDPLDSSNVSSPRALLLAGLGLSYKPWPFAEAYANFSQNYKSISYSDIRVDIPTLEIDPEISDERGYNLELGMRGNIRKRINFDATLFYLRYNDRIGAILQKDAGNRIYRLKTNVGDARNLGLETFVETDLLAWGDRDFTSQLTWFVNTTFLKTSYINATPDINGNAVEFSPNLNLRTGLTYKRKAFQAALQFSYLGQQYSDATNAPNDPPVPGSVEGTIPAYYVADLTMRYKVLNWLSVEGSINNLTDNYYFTRRATGYPGPGIIPSDGRTMYFTVTGTF